jgi:hypothetical protein
MKVAPRRSPERPGARGRTTDQRRWLGPWEAAGAGVVAATGADVLDGVGAKETVAAAGAAGAAVAAVGPGSTRWVAPLVRTR